MTSVGVTGHRSLSDTSSIIRVIDTALSKIRKAFSEPFVLYSSLAEGADRLVARRAFIILQASLVVPLPMLLAKYLSNFSLDSQAELDTLLQQASEVIELPMQATCNLSYEAAGRYILDNTDVMIAIWDGQPAIGRGGTGQIVNEARQRCMPLAWVLAGNRNLKYKDDQEFITLERFPE